MQSLAKTVKEYLDELSDDRRKSIEAVRRMIRKNLPDGYAEMMQYGMIGYVVPLRLYPQGYCNDRTRPLPYVSLASQKNYMAVYLMGIYGDAEQWFIEEYKKTGKRMDIGKCCVRFKKLEDLPLELIGKAVAKISVKEMITRYERRRI
ncbi:MAG: DUF1801 domain-containing protein [Candidatus Omnitrophota bacterium]